MTLWYVAVDLPTEFNHIGAIFLSRGLLGFVISRRSKLKLAAAVFGLIPLLFGSANAIAACTGYPGVPVSGNIVTFVAPPLTISRDHMISNYGANGPEGALIYDQTAKVLKVCDGTSWQTVVSGGGGASQWTNGAAGAIYYSGGNVGIGTTNLAAPLHIVKTGVTSTADILRLAGAIDGSNIDSVLNIQAIYESGAGSAYNFQVGKWNGSSYQPYTNVLTMRPSGNVGIGTTNPAGLLDLRPEASNYALFIRAAASPAQNLIQVRDSAGQYRWRLDQNFSMVLTTAAGVDTISLASDGTAYKPGGGSWTASSDARLKNIDAPFEQGLGAIAKLRTVRFHYKKDNPRREPSDRSFVGLIAQEVRTVFPEAVSERDDGYLDLDTTPINFALINAVKELKAANDNLAAENADLRKRVSKLEQAE